MTDVNGKIMDILGFARRAGKLIMGQDHVFAELKKREQLLVIVTNDCSKNVLISVDAGVERAEVLKIILNNIDRTALGEHLGVRGAQIAAIPMQSGFAKKILLLNDRSDADE